MDCNQIICFGLVVYPHITSPVSQRSRYVALSNNYKPLSDWTYVCITRTIPNLLVSPFFSCILMYFVSLVNYIKTWKYRFCFHFNSPLRLVIYMRAKNSFGAACSRNAYRRTNVAEGACSSRVVVVKLLQH